MTWFSHLSLSVVLKLWILRADCIHVTNAVRDVVKDMSQTDEIHFVVVAACLIYLFVYWFSIFFCLFNLFKNLFLLIFFFCFLLLEYSLTDQLPSGIVVKNLPANAGDARDQEAWVWSLDWEDPLEEEMETHSSIIAWKIPGTEEPVGLYAMGSQRVGHDWAHVHGHMHSWLC